MFAHKGLNARIRLPLFPVVLVASDVHEVVGKNGCHLSDESIEELISALSREIHHRIEDSELALDFEGAGRAGEIGISNEPCAGVSRHIELGNYTDAVGARVGNNFAGLLLGIEKSVGTQLSELGKCPTLHAEALVFTQMPVEDVELNGGHSVEGTSDHVDRHEVASTVDHQAAPTKTWRVVNRHCRNKITGSIGLHELLQSLEAMHGSHHSSGVQASARGSYVERVGLIFVD